MAKKTLLVLSLLLLAVFIYGCGQTTTINSLFAKPKNLSIRGTVYYYNFSIAVSSAKGDPIKSAYLRLDGESGTYATTTDDNGQYIFKDLPDGSYMLNATAEGCVILTPMNIELKPWSEGIPADGTITTNDITLFNIVYIESYSPSPSAEVTNDPTFVVTFSAPMDTTTVRYRLFPQGIRESSAGNTTQLNVAWTNNDRTATITPVGSLISNEVYRLQLDYSTFQYPLDKKGRFLYASDYSTAPGLVGLDNLLNSWADYRVVAGGVPGAPSDLQVSYLIGATMTTEADAINYWNDLWLGDVMFFCWDSPAGGPPITGYNVYVTNGSSNNYHKLNKTPVYTNQFTTNTQSFEKLFWPQGVTWSDPVCAGEYPFINNKVKIKVVAYNGEGEGAGVEVTKGDSISPKILGAKSANSAYAGAILNNNYYLNKIIASEIGVAYIVMTEPIKLSTITNAITVSGPTPVTATYLTQSSGTLGIAGMTTGMSVIKLDAGTADIRGKTVTISSGMTDLIGNPVVSGSGDTIVLP